MISDKQANQLIEKIDELEKKVIWCERSISILANLVRPSEPEGIDSKFNETCYLLLKHDDISSSVIQRKFEIGYARSSRLIDYLCEAGLVSKPKGSLPRKVFTEKVEAYLKDNQYEDKK